MIEQIGQFRIVEEIGAGGMGVVYRAFDVAVQREVAIKRLRSEFAASPAVLERFRNEAKLQGRLNHPNIAQLYSIVQTQEAFCIVMELVEGVTVRDLLPLPWAAASAVLLQALDALGYAHRLGVLHRDIKPENLIIDRHGVVKVMDFGIAYAVGSERMTREKTLIGTIEYMSPERILGRPMDGRSDIYALGILFFEMLSGRLPFDTSSEYDLMRNQIESEPPAVTDFADVSRALDGAIRKAMQKDAEQRYANCEAMSADMRALLPGTPATAEELARLCAAHRQGREPAPFEALPCWTATRDLIERGDLAGAERLLRAESHSHPREQELHGYLEIVVTAQAQMEAARWAQGDDAETAPMPAWLRLIAAERVADREGYTRELERLRATHPDAPLTRLLASSEVEV